MATHTSQWTSEAIRGTPWSSVARCGTPRHSAAIAPVERFLCLRGRGHVASQHLQCGPKRLQRVEGGHLGFARVHVGLAVPGSYLQVSEGCAVRRVPNLE